ncbi:hypothetical protein PM082_001854 [Marasmius tenuissimus]|nr:hypothetical protein PM082_001854 [Marasmius tenuissimus]
MDGTTRIPTSIIPNFIYYGISQMYCMYFTVPYTFICLQLLYVCTRHLLCRTSTSFSIEYEIINLRGQPVSVIAHSRPQHLPAAVVKFSVLREPSLETRASSGLMRPGGESHGKQE